jgi:hypothetical protein
MVWVGSLFVNGSSESLEPIVEFAGERDRDVWRSERRNHLKSSRFQVGDRVDRQDREPSRRTGAGVPKPPCG